MMYRDYPLFNSPYAHGIFFALVPFVIIAAVWTLVLKGFALWYAARGEQKWWFIALLLINTLGILEIIYLIWYRPQPHQHTPAHHSSAQA